MRGLLVCLAPPILAGVLLSFPRVEAGAPAPRPERRIPFTTRAHKVILPVTVGGSRVLEVILDTGMPFEGLLIYNSALLDSVELQSPVRAQVGGAGSGSPQTAVMADSMSFRVGEVPFDGQRIIILEGGAMRGFPSDGVCGYSLFGRYAVEIDPAVSAVTLHDPDSFSADASWTALPLTFKAGTIPWVEVAASTVEPDSAVLSCYIDLASSEALEVLVRDGMPLDLPAALEDVYLGRGLSGDIRGQKGRVAWVRLGPYRMDGVEAAFTPAEVRSKQPGADGVLGNGLLDRFRCVFDYRAGRLYLKPTTRAETRH